MSRRPSRRRLMKSLSITEGCFVQPLEHRLLFAANMVTVSSANALSFIGSSNNNDVTESYSAGVYTLSDTADVINVTNNGTAVVSGNGTKTITVSGISSLSFNTGGGSDVFNIQSTKVPTLVDNTYTGVGTAQAVNIGNAGSLAGINAAVTVNDSLAYTDLKVDDSNGAAGVSATLNVDNSNDQGNIGGLAPATIYFRPGDISGLAVDMPSASSTFKVNGTVAGATTTLNLTGGNDVLTVASTSSTGKLTINGEGGSDIVSIGDSSGVQHIDGLVYLANAGSATLSLNDSGDTTGRTTTISNTAVTGLAPANITYSAGEVTEVQVTGSSGSDAFNVTPASGTSFVLDGFSQSTSSGDALKVNLAGVSGAVNSDTVSAGGHAGTWSFSNAGTVYYSDFETLSPSADLSVTDTAPAKVTEGQQVTESISVTNHSSAAAPGVVITDSRSSNARFVSASFPGGTVTSVDHTNGVTTISLGTIPAGATVKGTVILTAVSDGTLTNTASVASNYPDLNLANNSGSAGTSVAEAALTPNSASFSPHHGQSFTGVVGSFADGNTASTDASIYTARITWGDGTAVTTGTITYSSSTQRFSVTGTHTYAKTGKYNVTIAVSEGSVSTSIISYANVI